LPNCRIDAAGFEFLRCLLLMKCHLFLQIPVEALPPKQNRELPQ
jgi:hypothetical protein